MHIGIAGIGKMGSNIGARLMEIGHTLTVWNRTADKVKPLADAGASTATTPAELTSAVEAIITIITECRRHRCGLSRPARPSFGRRERQAVHRDEHGAA